MEFDIQVGDEVIIIKDSRSTGMPKEIGKRAKVKKIVNKFGKNCLVLEGYHPYGIKVPVYNSWSGYFHKSVCSISSDRVRKIFRYEQEQMEI